MDESEHEELHNGIQVLESASKLPARSRAVNIVPYVEDIVKYAYQYGLHNADLRQLVGILGSKNELDQSSCTTLIKHLFPASKISSDIVLAAVGALGQGSCKPTWASQANLVRWITAVQNDLQSSDDLVRFYHVLFSCLDINSIRTPICQLLGAITQKKHVRPFRIQRLLSLCQQFGSDRALVDLLRIYKNFQPDILIAANPQGRAPASSFDAEWMGRLRAIQNAARSLGQPEGHASGFRLRRNGDGKTKMNAVPQVHSFFANSSAVTLESINSASELVDKLEMIEAPSQIIASLGDPLLQKYLELRNFDELAMRFDFWLRRHLQDEIELLHEGFGLSPTLSSLLAGIVSFTEARQALPLVVEEFLKVYLPLWDGQSNLGLIIDLAAFVSPREFKVLYSSILGPLEQAILHGAHEPLNTLLDLYGKIVQRWVVVLSDQKDQSAIASESWREYFIELHKHVATLLLTSLVRSCRSVPAVLRYLDNVYSTTLEAMLEDEAAKIPAGFVTSYAFYLLLMTRSISGLSRLCHILERYYVGQWNRPDRFKDGSLGTDINCINRYLMDTCNLLYRGRALDTKDSVAAGCLCPSATKQELESYLPQVNQDYSLATIFGLSSHPLIASMANAAFNDYQTRLGLQPVHQAPVGQASLLLLVRKGGIDLSWKEYRKLVLNWLTQHGFTGIERLLCAAIRDLNN